MRTPPLIPRRLRSALAVLIPTLLVLGLLPTPAHGQEFPLKVAVTANPEKATEREDRVHEDHRERYLPGIERVG